MSERPERHSRGLLDTNVIVHLPRVDPGELPIETAISSITLAELTAGPHATDDPVERAVRIGRLQRVEAAYDPLPFDAEAARHYGPVYAAGLAANRTPRRRLADLLIACVAIANDLPLYTINPGDFTGLEHLLQVAPVTRP
ncbi:MULTISPECIES: type II toxin-antitoxin system VapC family toxin [Protofrankia]|uniref:PilT protein domain protein n=1 Tax=Candidatus Protofrankia datiscae TaxID=2716812 RepID=F8B1A2_9ACTN|nr:MULTISPECIES: type II toxin-antitoxin system VapC family toxin [Protofrankia]AEH08849.1 PilT protein domain protein [Candidatus Protofrankia datiscae]